MNPTKEVLGKWSGSLVVIYRLDNILLFYNKDNDPKFKKHQIVSIDEATSSKPYKACAFNWNNIPHDVYMNFIF